MPSQRIEPCDSVDLVAEKFEADRFFVVWLAERGVRFIQLFHRGWDQHANLPKAIAGQCRDTDQPSAALIADLQQRGMLDDTLVVWGVNVVVAFYSLALLEWVLVGVVIDLLRWLRNRNRAEILPTSENVKT